MIVILDVDSVPLSARSTECGSTAASFEDRGSLCLAVLSCRCCLYASMETCVEGGHFNNIYTSLGNAKVASASPIHLLKF